MKYGPTYLTVRILFLFLCVIIFSFKQHKAKYIRVCFNRDFKMDYGGKKKVIEEQQVNVSPLSNHV